MRGIHDGLVSDVAPQGITPAHAGNTTTWKICKPSSGDHPRACGEYGSDHQFGAALLGSPPRMRGILYDFLNHITDPGITPAHAGNTDPASSRHETTQDHPRACGEYALFLWTWLEE